MYLNYRIKQIFSWRRPSKNLFNFIVYVNISKIIPTHSFFEGFGGQQLFGDAPNYYSNAIPSYGSGQHSYQSQGQNQNQGIIAAGHVNE